MVVNVENSIVSTGSTALEVLQRTPGITIDKDDHIVLKGKAGVTVMLDGKLTYLSADQISNLLKNMASENIARIELITNPSAKYDAAGNTGIVNIITKKGRKTGLNGNVTARVSYGHYPKYNSGLTLNYKTSHSNFFGTLNYSWRRNYQIRYSKTVFRIDTLVSNELNNTQINFGRHAQYKAGVDITLSKKSTLGFVFNGFTGHWGLTTTGTTQSANNRKGHQDTLFKTVNALIDPYSNSTFAANYKLTLDSLGQELTFDADYAHFSENATSSQGNYPFTGIPPVRNDNVTSQNSYQPSFITIKTAKFDYIHPLDSTVKLEGGTKGSWVKSLNDFSYDSLTNGIAARPRRENNFIYSERILAAYLRGSFKWSNFTLQTGLRLENTRSTGNLVSAASVTSRNYTDFFPNLSLTQKFSDMHQLAFSFTRRINRPDYGNLNPFIFYLDKKSYFTGNPNLKPEYTLQYELSYNFKQKYIATISYNNTRNYINEFVKSDPINQITQYSVQNFNNQDTYNVALSAPGDFTSWWTSTNSVSVNYNMYTNQFISSAVNPNATTFNFNIIETFKLGDDWKAELNGNYNSPNYDGTYRYRATSAIGIGLQKTLLKKQADLKLNAADVLNSQHFYGDAHFNNVDVKIRNKWESRRLTISFTYRFGGVVGDADKKKSSGSSESNQVGGKG